MQTPWKANRELERELEHHVEALADSYERQGMSREEAMRQARKEFGGMEQVKERCRDESRWNWFTQLGQDLQFGVRMMRKTPAITAAALVSLALGIGATTMILSLAETLLWRTLPVPAAHQISEVFWVAKGRVEVYQGGSGSSFPDEGLRVADFFATHTVQAMRERLKGQAEIAAHTHPELVSTSYKGNVVVATLRPVSGNFFATLRLNPAAGRAFTEADDQSGSAPTVIVTWRFAAKNLGGAEQALNQQIRINDVQYTIVGVLPGEFLGIVPGDPTDLYAPIQQGPPMLAADSWFRRASPDPLAWWMQLLIRRAPGVTEAQAQQSLDAAFVGSLVKKPAKAEMMPHIRLRQASEGLGEVRRSMGSPILVLLGLVFLVLVIACANIANLLLARAVSREKEVALRISLGCGSGRLIRQLFTESLLLALIGGTLSIPVALLLTNLIAGLLEARGRMTIPTSINLTMLAVTAGVTMLTAVLFGLYPAWRATRVDAGPALKEGSGTANTSSRSNWTPARLLVLVQVALGVLLLSAAILFTERFVQLTNTDTGFNRGQLLLVDLRPGEVGLRKERLAQFYSQLEDRIAGIPGVSDVALSQVRPMVGGGWWGGVQMPGSSKTIDVSIYGCTHNFLDALGVALLAGRAPTRQEIDSQTRVMVISEDLGRQLGVASPVGLRLKYNDELFEVVGVARSGHYGRVDREVPMIYVPFDPSTAASTMLVRSSLPPAALLQPIRKEVRALHPDLPLVDVFTMDQQIARTLHRERLFAYLCGSFGVLALVLSIVGLYGLMSHTTARRIPEIGIRMALGASRARVVKQVFFDGFRLTALGLVLGIPPALYLAKLAVQQQMLPATSTPQAALIAATAILGLAAAISILVPAIRAATVNPLSALRRN